MTYGLLRYLNADVELGESDPVIGFNYLGRLGAAAGELSEEFWRISPEGLAVTGAAAAVPTPLAHAVSSTRHRRDRHRSAAARQLDLGAIGG